jgi:hypothetical protein
MDEGYQMSMKIIAYSLGMAFSLALSSGLAEAKVAKPMVCADYTHSLCPGLDGQLGAQRSCLAKHVGKLSPACRAWVERK